MPNNISMFDIILDIFLFGSNSDEENLAKLTMDTYSDENPKKRSSKRRISREAAKQRHSLARKKAAYKRKHPRLQYHRTILELEQTADFRYRKSSLKSISSGLNDYEDEIEDEREEKFRQAEAEKTEQFEKQNIMYNLKIAFERKAFYERILCEVNMGIETLLKSLVNNNSSE